MDIGAKKVEEQEIGEVCMKATELMCLSHQLEGM